MAQHTFESDDISDLELDLLLLFYQFSDQTGTVDVDAAADWMFAHFGALVQRIPFKLEQRHVDLLMDRGMVPDTRLLFNKLHLMAAQPKKERRKRDDSNPAV